MTNSPDTLILGSTGLAGSAVARALPNATTASRADGWDFSDFRSVLRLFRDVGPKKVVLCAAKVGGITANRDYPVDFLLRNLQIQNNVISLAHEFGVGRLVFLGSNCIYPKHAEQPIQPDALLTGPLEPTNRPYAVAKIAGIELCNAYRTQYGFNAVSLMPCNLYGPGDNYREGESHVLPALLRRFHEAKMLGQPSVKVGGDGSPLREFLHADDLASAVVLALETPDLPPVVNVGSGEEVSIYILAHRIADVVGYDGKIQFDESIPNGTPRKRLDSRVLKSFGWSPKWGLVSGLRDTYAAFKRELASGDIRA